MKNSHFSLLLKKHNLLGLKELNRTAFGWFGKNHRTKKEVSFVHLESDNDLEKAQTLCAEFPDLEICCVRKTSTSSLFFRRVTYRIEGYLENLFDRAPEEPEPFEWYFYTKPLLRQLIEAKAKMRNTSVELDETGTIKIPDWFQGNGFYHNEHYLITTQAKSCFSWDDGEGNSSHLVLAVRVDTPSWITSLKYLGHMIILKLNRA
jgi:hypothetical protein